MWGSEKLQLFRATTYILLIICVSILSSFVGDQVSYSEIGRALMFISIVTLGQSVASLGRIPLQGALAFFLADAVVAAVLVRSTGGLTSPMLVLFPLISLGAAIVLSKWWSIASVLVFLVISLNLAINFGVSSFGHTVAIFLTAGLGYYLARALSLSGHALQISESARKRLENLQKAILANIPSGLMSIDPEGRIIQVNHVGVRILGMTETQLLGKGLREIWPELHSQVIKMSTLLPVINSDFESEASGERRSVEYVNAQKEKLQMGYSVARLKDFQGDAFLGTLVVFQDLTEVVKMEETLRTSEKLAAIGKLAAGIAHEIRNPLAGISGSAQLLEGHAGLNSEDHKLLNIIKRESSRLDQLISEFLEYVRPPKIKLNEVDLVELVRNVVESLRVNSKWTGLKCEIEIIHEPATFLVDGEANKIIQILMNLILNAGQAGADKVVIRFEYPGALSVEDNGTGISSEHLSRLFEPFFTTKEGGTGLGLATSYKALEAMGASIKVRSPWPSNQTKGGAIFQIQFAVPNKTKS